MIQARHSFRAHTLSNPKSGRHARLGQEAGNNTRNMNPLSLNRVLVNESRTLPLSVRVNPNRHAAALYIDDDQSLRVNFGHAAVTSFLYHGCTCSMISH